MFAKLLPFLLIGNSILASPLQSKKLQIKPHILNGEKAKLNQFPYMVSLREYQKNDDVYAHHCGGSLISDRWILSANHCFPRNAKTYNTSNILIVVGTNEI